MQMISGGGMRMWKQYHERKMHTICSVKIVLMCITTGIKA